MHPKCSVPFHSNSLRPQNGVTEPHDEKYQITGKSALWPIMKISAYGTRKLNGNFGFAMIDPLKQ